MVIFNSYVKLPEGYTYQPFPDTSIVSCSDSCPRSAQPRLSRNRSPAVFRRVACLVLFGADSCGSNSWKYPTWWFWFWCYSFREFSACMSHVMPFEKSWQVFMMQFDGIAAKSCLWILECLELETDRGEMRKYSEISNRRWLQRYFPLAFDSVLGRSWLTCHGPMFGPVKNPTAGSKPSICIGISMIILWWYMAWNIPFNLNHHL